MNGDPAHGRLWDGAGGDDPAPGDHLGGRLRPAGVGYLERPPAAFVKRLLPV